MSIEPSKFDALIAIQYWCIAILASLFVGLAMGFAASVAGNGLISGPSIFWRTIKNGIKDLTQISTRRVGALAFLTIKEAISRRAFVIGALFVLLFMFGGWFLGSSNAEKPALPYITFVMSAMYFLLSLMAILIACWGLPADIKAKSLHTVVTKPVRRSEIVIGRIVGYSSVVLLVLVVTSVFGFIWIERQVPELAQKQLVARVPVYGSLGFRRTDGEEFAGKNVGDVWEYRSYVEGLTPERARWIFTNLDKAELQKQGEIRLEQTFEAFRTYKGEITQQTRFGITVINPTTGLSAPLEEFFPVQEHKSDPELSIVTIPREWTFLDSYDENAEEKTVNLFDELFDGNSLTLEVMCVDVQQFIGCAEGDLFIRMKDRSFLESYIKANIGLALMLVMVVTIGTTSSCFLKGPVSTLLTGTLIILGNSIYTYIAEVEKQLAETGRPLGGGVIESIFRLVTKMNQTTALPDNLGMGKIIIEKLDQSVFNVLFIIRAIVPNFSYFNMNKYTANGFDVPWNGAMLPSLLTTIGFIFPLIAIGYFSLQLRELEHK